MAKYELITGVQKKALRVVLYGVAGIGKTTLAAEFPNPVFIDVEDGSNQLPVARLPRPTSWEMLMDEVREVRAGAVPCSTLVVDTADAAEELCVRSICAEKGWDSIEAPGYGKGWTYLAEKYGKLLGLLGEVVDGGRNVVVVSHSMARKFERPDEEGAYDRYELKLSKKVAPMVKEWADMLLFCDYKIYVETQSDNKGKVTKAKAKGGRRIIHTTHHPCWDAKNRFGLADELPLSYAGLAPYVPDMAMGGRTVDGVPVTKPDPAPKADVAKSVATTAEMAKVDERIARMEAEVESVAKHVESDRRDSYPPRLKPLVDLMAADGIGDEDLRRAMAAKGYVTYDTPVASYQQRLVDGVIASWANFVKFVQEQRQAIA